MDPGLSTVAGEMLVIDMTVDRMSIDFTISPWGICAALSGAVTLVVICATLLSRSKTLFYVLSALSALGGVVLLPTVLITMMYFWPPLLIYPLLCLSAFLGSYVSFMAAGATSPQQGTGPRPGPAPAPPQ